MPFHQVVNQHHAVYLLRDAARRGRPAHAYLLVGPAGVGRRTLAVALAEFLNCKQPDGDACGECTHCRRIPAGNHPDVRVLDIAAGRFLVPPPKDYKAHEIPIDQIRALKQDAYFPPYEGRWKVYVIADAELLSPGAANSLLKVLEEPPPNVVLVLVAESTLPLPPTIVSRCQLVRCALVPAAEIERALIERKELPADRARFLAALAAGRVAKAVEWAETPDLLEERNRFLRLLIDLEGGDPLLALDGAEEWGSGSKKERLPEMLEAAGFWYRDLLVWRESRDPAMIINLDRRPDIERLAGVLSPDVLRARFDAIEAAKDSLDRNGQPRLVLENLFLRIGITRAAV